MRPDPPASRPSPRVAKAEEIFSSALTLSVHERDAFVVAECAGDDAMGAELLALLTAHESAGEFMRDDAPAAPELDRELARLKPEKEGERIGRYKLLQEIGEGGFGTVWMAEQMEPVSRRVALKIIKLGMDTREVIARFESERQALAMMEHPNIAKVFDAGATPLGRPYFVMELVRGIPITQYCDEGGLGTRERLALFGDVCSAINHAHQKGVIHRDIKPSNVMITLHGEKPIAKVIDFGIAKATQGKLTDKTLFTRFEQFIGTPVYMSPEQASWSGLDVDTRSDIYSLGILLYELLTGKPPFDAETMASAGPDEIRRMIRDVEPPKPSTRLRTSAGEERIRIAKARQIEPRKVRGLVEPDLDWIVMKAIDKDRTRRYQTANGLALDIQRFLADEPVSARPPSAAYQFQKFARRHKVALRVAAGIIAVLVAATLVSTWQAVRARRAEQKAKAAEKESTAQRIRADGEAETAQQNLYYAQMHLAQQAWREHRGLKHMRDLLAGWLPARGSPDRRGWEWYYLSSLPYQNLRTLTQSGSSNRPSTVAWHVASGRLAEGTADGSIRIWDVDLEQTTLVLKGPAPGNQYWGSKWLAWNPDGSKLAAGCSDGTVHVWDVASGKKSRVLQAHQSPVLAVAFSSDGTRLAAWEPGGAITIWEAESGRVTAEVVHPNMVTEGVWSPDDKLLASGHEDGTVTFSGTQAGDPIVSLRGQTDLIYELAWSPDSTRLAATGATDFSVTIWDVASQQKLLGPLRHSHGILSIAWEPNGKRIATGSIDQTIKVWDAVTGQEAVTLRGHEDSVTSLSWGPNGRLASGGSAGSTKIWDSFHDQESRVLAGHGRRTTSIAWSPDGQRLASAGDDGTVRIWDGVTREEMLSINAHDEGKIMSQFGLIHSIAWNPDGTRVASAGHDGATKVWDVATGREVLALAADHGVVWCVAWNPDGTALAAGSQDGTIRIAEDLKATPSVRFFQAHESPGRDSDRREGVRALAWSPEGNRLASAGFDKLVKIWDPHRGAEVVRMEGHTGWVTGVSWSPDGKRLASSSSDYLVTTWDAQTGQKLQTMRGHNDFVAAVRWSPDGSRLASAGIDNSVRIWDPRTGQETFVLRGASGMFHDAAWNSDGAQLAAVSSEGQIWIWDATRGFKRDATAQASP
jgi:WD40 repeat protein/serine/threonine protein kinase